MSQRIASLLAEAFGDIGPLQQELNAFEDDLRRRYPALKVFNVSVYNEGRDDPYVYLQHIEVEKQERGQGVGTKVMEELQQWAKNHGLRIVLERDNARGKKAPLDRFYGRLGFEKNKGRNRDFRVSGTHTWKPTESLVAKRMLGERDEEVPEEDANEARAKMLFGRDVGLNADWSVSAWFLGPGQANRTPGAYYLLDNEDGTWSIVQRFYDDDEEYDPDNVGIHEIFTSEVFNEVLERAREIRDKHRQAPS